MASAAVSVLLADRAGAPVAPIDALIADPKGWLLRPDALGRADGAGIDPAKVAALVMALGELVGIERDGDALLLPAGLRLSATGANPLDLGLQGQIDIGPEDLLGFDLGMLITPALEVSGRGDLRLEVTLPGDWGKVAIAFAADPAGLGLTVTPDGAAAITLLPRFDGLGALQAGAATLLPRALQAIVDELRDGAPPTGLLAAALALAEAVGIYADDAQGFEHPDRAAELARMLQPGWIESKTGTAGAVADALEGLFGAPPLVDLPIGAVTRAGDAIRWRYQLPVVGGEVRVTGGWTGAGAAVQPAVLIEALDLDLGPVVVESAAFGYDGDVSAALVARLDVEGPLAFLRPALRVDVTEERFALDLLPLGVAEEADLAVRIVPVPGVEATADGALALLEQWGVPLAATVLLDAFEDRLGDPLWGGGPSSRAVLVASGLLDGAAGPPALASPLPPLPSVLLRAAQTLLDGLEVAITTEPLLQLSFVTEDGRSGVRLSGRVEAGDGDMVVSVRFGDADWLDETGGVTLWLIETTTDPIPVRLAPGLGIAGVGVVLTGTEEQPLLDGAFRSAPPAACSSWRRSSSTPPATRRSWWATSAPASSSATARWCSAPTRRLVPPARAAARDAVAVRPLRRLQPGRRARVPRPGQRRRQRLRADLPARPRLRGHPDLGADRAARDRERDRRGRGGAQRRGLRGPGRRRGAADRRDRGDPGGRRRARFRPPDGVGLSLDASRSRSAASS